MNNILIGIISYLPDDKEVREHRFNILKWLVHVCNYLFELPIYIVVQNYDEEEENILKKCKNVTLSTNYEKLGILKARRVLRDYFINSAYTNLIMLDDDCVIVGTIAQAKNYLKQIYDNRDCFIEFNDTLLKLFCISKEIFKEVDYEDVEPEKGEGFEDRIFVNKLRNLYKDKRRIFIKDGLEEYSTSTKDEYSTWYTTQDIEKMLSLSIK